LPFFKGSQINDYRRQEFERFRCGSSFYSVIRSEPQELCKKYLYSIGFYTFGGAYGENLILLTL